MSHQLIEISQNLVKVRWSVKILVIGWPEKLYLARFALMSKQRWSFLMAGCYMRKMWSFFMSKTVGSKLPLLLYSSRLSCPSMHDSWLSPAVASFFKFILYLSPAVALFFNMQDGWLSPAVASFFKFISYLSQVLTPPFLAAFPFDFVLIAWLEVVLVDDYVGRTAE
ncbi:hypothetical protein KY290_022482 [Solanum tuberosum]|uniref:Uncharacterized protein n=1 Tax=Solanum tuberosum TaxID=4113 RepID=A0ABQ7V4H6_SOLTU|nr:hypothetical protein KY284_021383 [Solanum tuberosum]KAH0758989.1 hypothetical protein KY290_022482 [Solanum tuberosum]